MAQARATWTDERLDDLGRRVEFGFQSVDADLRSLNERMDAGFRSVDAKIDTKIDSLEATVFRMVGGATATILAAIVTVALAGG